MEDYSQYSHAGYDVLEGDIIRELMKLKKLSDEDKSFELSCLAQRIYDANGGQYDMAIIESLIDKNSHLIW